jgi:two-component sensor histidine kinase
MKFTSVKAIPFFLFHLLTHINPRYLVVAGVLLCCVLHTAGQNINRQMVNQLLTQLRKSKMDEGRINTLVELGKFHVFKAGEAKADLDSSSSYLKQAQGLSDSLHLQHWQHETESLLMVVDMERKDTVAGSNRFNQLISECRKTGDKEIEAATKIRLGVWLTAKGGEYKKVLDNYRQAVKLYREIDNREGEIKALQGIANIHINEGNIKLAEEELVNVLEQYKSIHYPKLHYTYNLLSIVSRIQGDFNKGLLYSIQCVESMNKTQDTLSQAGFYGDLARMYLEVGNREKSIEYYKISLSKWRQEGLPNFSLFAAAGFIAKELIAQNKPREAFHLIDNVRKEIPPITVIQHAGIAQHLAYCYEAMQQYTLAEKYYLESAKWYSQATMDFEASQGIQEDIGKFYLARKDYKNAGIHLRRALSFYPQKNALATVKDIHYMLYKVDSAEKNYLSALDHFREHKELNDSIFNDKKSKQIEELQIKYETDRKQTDINLLNNHTKLQQAQLDQANLTKDVTFVGVVLLIIIIALLYNQYLIKYRSNKQLQAQQTEISGKNDSLQHLVEEKEWLLKEVNHRVKNNLHTVMSLLESQSAYLDNEALQAVHDSRNRVYAMSLIHQKLYQTDNVAAINMSVYLPELVEHLRDSFEMGQQIRFHLQILSVEVDVSQAVPLGLILNEAITNCIKYAFPDKRPNKDIHISMQERVNNQIELVIEDNGQGLPPDFDSTRTSSLGMKLMKGLTEDINGIFAITSDHGTKISVTFQPTILFR